MSAQHIGRLTDESTRRLQVMIIGVATVVYSIVVLGFVGTSPDVRIRALLADPDRDESTPGMVVRAVVGAEIAEEIPRWVPREGDVLQRLGDHPIRSFLDYIAAVEEMRDARIGPDGVLDEGAHPSEIGSNRLPPVIEIGTDRYVEVSLFRPAENTTIETWLKVKSQPLGEVLLTFLWLVLQSGVFAVSALAAWHRPYDKGTHLFFRMCAVSMVAFIGGFHWWVVTANLLLNIPFLICAVLLPAVCLHFFLSYPRRLFPMDRHPRITVPVMYAIPGLTSAAMLGLLGTSWWVTEPQMSDDSIRTVVWCLTVLRQFIYAYLAFAGACFFIMLIALGGEYLSTSNPQERNQMKWLFRAGIISAIPVCYTLYLALFHRVDFALGSARMPMFLASLSFTLAYAIGIIRYKLMLIDQFLSRGMLYYAASQGLTLGYGVSVALVVFFASDLNVPWIIPGRFQHILSIGVLLTFSVILMSWTRDRFQKSIDRRFYREKYQLDKAMQRVNRALDTMVDRHTLGQRMLASCREVLGAGLSALYVRDTGSRVFRLISMDGDGVLPEQVVAEPEMLELLRRDSAIQQIPGNNNETGTTQETLKNLNCELLFALQSDGEVDSFVALSQRKNGAAYSAEDLTFLNTLGVFTTVALRSAKVSQDFTRLNEELQLKVSKIEEQSRQIAMMQAELTHSEVPQAIRDQRELQRGMIKGNSPAIGSVLKTVEKVAVSESTVLIQGASGTGKELLAQAIHENSPRRNGPLVRVHCAALSPSLLESELFGHVKGAFTGAHKYRVGRFELANGGTLFLDEIGDISLETQIKLLRVLQTRSFEPVGGVRTVEVDVRLITATHQDLHKLIAAGRFREDLFYRLNVVNITLPTLAERKDDIFELALHFLKQSSAGLEKRVTHIDEDALAALQNYHWPGNIRELENVIERAVVLCDGNHISLSELPPEILHPAQVRSSVPRALPERASGKDVVLSAPSSDVVESVRETMNEGIYEFFSKLKKAGLS